MTVPPRLTLALAVTAAAAAVTGCAGGQPRAASGATAATAARSEVFTAVRSVYEQRFYRYRIGYAAAVDGGYEPCARGTVRFIGGTGLSPFSGHISLAGYAGALTRALSQAGWAVRRQTPPVQGSGPVSFYGIRKGALAGDIYVVPGPSGVPRATLGLHSTCFSPGSSRVLTVRSYHAALPHPTATG